MIKNKKIHEYFQEKALNKAIKQLIGYIGYYYIEEKKLLFNIKREYIELIDKLNFNLPSWNEIAILAKTIYKNFDETLVQKIVYTFSYLSIEKDLKICAKDSDIVMGHNNFTNLIITAANKVKIYGDPIEDGKIDINAKDIELISNSFYTKKDIKLTSETILFYRSDLTSLQNIYIDSKFIELKHAKIMSSDILTLKSNLIVSDNSMLTTLNKIAIIDTNCDEIKGVHAPVIIYNGQDISYNEAILMPKLRSNLIEVLRKVRNKISVDIDNELKIETKKLKEELNNKPITKILKK